MRNNFFLSKLPHSGIKKKKKKKFYEIKNKQKEYLSINMNVFKT